MVLYFDKRREESKRAAKNIQKKIKDLESEMRRDRQTREEPVRRRVARAPTRMRVGSPAWEVRYYEMVRNSPLGIAIPKQPQEDEEEWKERCRSYWQAAGIDSVVFYYSKSSGYLMCRARDSHLKGD